MGAVVLAFQRGDYIRDEAGDRFYYVLGYLEGRGMYELEDVRTGEVEHGAPEALHRHGFVKVPRG